MRHLIVLIAVLIWLGVMSTDAQACSCFPLGTPCESYGAASAVFAGTAISVRRAQEPKPGPVQPINYQRVFKFAVDQSYLGVAGTEIEIITGSGAGDCGYDFKIGEHYLVYAHLYETRLFTGICTRTKPFAAASEDLAFLGTLSSAPAGATISGRLVRENPAKNGGSSFPSDVVVVIEGSDTRHEIRPDAQGNYRLTGLPPGKFKVTLQLPETLITSRPEQEVNVADRGCATVPYQVTDNGRLSGKVVDAEGQQVSGIMLSLIDPSADPKTIPVKLDRTNADGRFNFSAIPAGRYLLAVNHQPFPDPKDSTLAYPPVFYPGVVDQANAEVITIGAGEKLTELHVRIPSRRPPSVVSVQVVWADGTPVAKALIGVKDVTDHERGFISGAQADDEGTFTMNGYIGQKLLIEARSNREYVSSGTQFQPMERSEKVRTTLSHPQEIVRIVVTKIR